MSSFVLRRWHLKLIALGLAIAVWVAVTGEGRGVSDFRVPVDFLLSPGSTLRYRSPARRCDRWHGGWFRAVVYGP